MEPPSERGFGSRWEMRTDLLNSPFPNSTWKSSTTSVVPSKLSLNPIHYVTHHVVKFHLEVDRWMNCWWTTPRTPSKRNITPRSKSCPSWRPPSRRSRHLNEWWHTGNRTCVDWVKCLIQGPMSWWIWEGLRMSAEHDRRCFGLWIWTP